MVSVASYRDFRPDAVTRGDGPASRALLPFVVFVRRDDGIVRRFDVLDGSRYCASRQAEDTLQVREELRGSTIAVVMEWNPRGQPLGIGEELQGPGDFAVVVESPAGIRRCVGVRASTRGEALELASRSVPGSRPVLASVRYRCLSRCASCGISLFEDLKIRETRRGLKCWDCW